MKSGSGVWPFFATGADGCGGVGAQAAKRAEIATNEARNVGILASKVKGDGESELVVMCLP